MSIADELVEVVGDEAAQRLVEHFGGERIYIPSRIPIDPLVIQQEVTALRSHGSTARTAYQTVAREHDLSVSTVMRMFRA